MGAQMALPMDARPNGAAPASPPELSETPPETVQVTAAASPVRRPTPDVVPMVAVWRRRLATVAVVLVAAVAAWVSYEHLHELVLRVGETGVRARVLPLSVDGLMVAASLSLLVRRQAGQPARLAWFSLVLGGAVSVAANVATAEPTLVGRMVAGWPPVALILAYELLMQIRGGGTDVQTPRPHTTPEGGSDGR